jgi:mannose-6-phosphate isomerase-like protein (cupin superfamily)
MKNFVLGLVVATGVMTGLVAQQTKINPTDPQPTCNMCPATYIPAEELQAYTKKAIEEKLVDQQVRSIDIGKANVAIGIEYRTKLDKPGANSVAEHDHVSEVYRILDGSATLVLGPDIVNRQRRPATQRTVVEFNGPGNNGESINNPLTVNLKAGDMVVIPAGTGHWFTKIDDHISYFMVRIDPDKVAPLKSEAQSKAYLSKPAPTGPAQ